MKIKAIFGVGAVLLASACSKEDAIGNSDVSTPTNPESSVEVPTTLPAPKGIDFRMRCNDGTQITFHNEPFEIVLDSVPAGSDSLETQDPNVMAEYATILGSLGTLEENASPEGFVVAPDLPVSDFALNVQRILAYPDESRTAIVFYNYSNGRGLSDTVKAVSNPDPNLPGIAMKTTDTKVEIRDYESGTGRTLEMISLSNETGELTTETIGDEAHPLLKTYVVNGQDGNLKNLDCDYFTLNKEAISI